MELLFYKLVDLIKKFKSSVSLFLLLNRDNDPSQNFCHNHMTSDSNEKLSLSKLFINFKTFKQFTEVIKFSQTALCQKKEGKILIVSEGRCEMTPSGI